MILARRLSQVTARFGANKNNSLSLLGPFEKNDYLKTLEENAVLNYRSYPALPHQDPKSPEYIHSELDEYHDEIEVQAYNAVIEQFKHDLKLQRDIWHSLAALDRPWKSGIPGVDTNLSDTLAEEKLPDLGFPRRDINNEQVWTFQNEDRFIANTVWNARPPFQHIIEWEKERLHRPVTRHFNHGKGYKYDVPFAPEEKY